MSNIEVLILNGAPGSGKSTIADCMSEELRILNQPHAVINVDELARFYPETDGNIKWKNLAAIWPNYSAVPSIKVILPVLMDDESSFEALKNAVPCDKFTICELVAPIDLLKARVSKREPNEFWQQKIRDLVIAYENKPVKFSNFQLSTEKSPPEQTAKDIIARLGWNK